MSEGGPCETPLIDLLRCIPEDAVFQWMEEVRGFRSWSSSPIGKHCHRAAAEIEQLRATSAIRSGKPFDTLAYAHSQARVAQLEQALHEYGQHHEACSYHGADDPDVCDCGYNEAWIDSGTTKDTATCGMIFFNGNTAYTCDQPDGHYGPCYVSSRVYPETEKNSGS